MIERLAALLLFIAPSLCWAQGNESTTSSENTEASDAVQIGAGSTSAVTTGSSGPEGPGDETVQPIAPSFSIVPGQDSFLGPGMLAIQRPDRLRCNMIADDNARERCNSRSTRNAAEGTDD